MESPKYQTKILLTFFLGVIGFLGCGRVGNEVPPTKADAISSVNPFIGTGGHGHTFPAATAPFGMVQVGPDTRIEGWDGCGGYHYSDSLLFGFSHTHLSGTGISDYGDLLFLPLPGGENIDDWVYEADSLRPKARVSFSHQNEKASPGFYEVKMGNGVLAQMVALPHSALHRYTFSAGKGELIVNLLHRDRLNAVSFFQRDDSTWVGHRDSKAWAPSQQIFFAFQFSSPPVSVSEKKVQGVGSPIARMFSFEGLPHNQLEIRVGLSGVSTEGALLNLQTEIPDWDWDRAKSQASGNWAQELGKVEVFGGSESQQKNFFTSLYHTFIQPNLWSDLNGGYRGRDGKIHVAENHNQYTVFSLWDTFRGAHPLYTLLQQKRTQDFIQTFLAQWREGGLLPMWELSANETDCMIGYHAVSVIADAWVKGIRGGYSAEEALQAMVSSARQNRLGIPEMAKNGFISSESESESVSKTLEYSYDDWCIAMLADSLGNEDLAKEFYARSQGWSHLLDTQTGFMRARQNGGWFSPFVPEEVNFHYTEANSWQYSFFVPHALGPWMSMLGGPDRLERRLDSLFTVSSQTSGREQADITGLIGQYAHGNEPSHHMAYLYVLAGKPWKTQEKVHEILETQYTPEPDGLAGNEDCGQMSAWYVLSSLGFYPICPGTDLYIIGAPLFPRVVLNLENGRHLEIVAKGVSTQAYYIQSAKLNGKSLDRAWIRHGELVSGGKLEFEMGEKPNLKWGLEPLPNRELGWESPVELAPAPVVEANSRTFTYSPQIQIHPNGNPVLEYSINGSPFQKSDTPVKISIHESSHLQVRGVAKGGRISPTVEANFLKIQPGRSLELLATYENQYNGGGNEALIDLIRGGKDFRTGGWQGFQGKDLKAILDLGKVQDVRKVGLSCLQDTRSWIWLPKSMEVSLSSDGEIWTLPFIGTHTVSDKTEEVLLHSLWVNLPPKTRCQFIKITAKTYGACPPWHLGAGGKAWIFADEILVE